MRRSRTTPIGRESGSSDSDQRLQDRQCFRCRVVAPDSSRGTNAYAKMFSAERPAPLVFKRRHLARVQQSVLEKKREREKRAQEMLGFCTEYVRCHRRNNVHLRAEHHRASLRNCRQCYTDRITVKTPSE